HRQQEPRRQRPLRGPCQRHPRYHAEGAMTALALSTGARARSFFSSPPPRCEHAVVVSTTGPALAMGPAGAPAGREAFIRRRLAAASAYPSEFVVLPGTRVVFHTPDRAEAVARYRALSTEAGEAELPALVEPGKRDVHPDPVLRGRGASAPTR